MMNEILKRFGNALLGIIALDGYRRTLSVDVLKPVIDDINSKQDIINKNLHLSENLKNINEEKSSLISKLMDDSIIKLEDLQNKIKFSTKMVDTKSVNDLPSVSESVNDLIIKDVFKKTESVVNELNEVKVVLDKIISKLEDINKSNKFIDGSAAAQLTDYITKFQDYMSSLNIIEQGALAHIIVNILLLSCIFDIIIILIGNIILDKLDIENKYPRIAKFIKYRRQYQKYNLILTFLIMIFFILYTIYVDLTVFM
jgi:hypothetical protein